MQWLSLPQQWGDYSLWALYPSPGEPPLPPKDELEGVIKKHAPSASVESFAHTNAIVQLPVTIDTSVRAIISEALRKRSHSHA